MNRPALVPEFYVSNLAASLEFYVGLLGFRVELLIEDPDGYLIRLSERLEPEAGDRR